jgi:replication-associated recombination protein RarA
MNLADKYRPTNWGDVVGQDKIVSRLRTLATRGGLAGRAFWLSGQSGTGKTTIARLIAREVADEFLIQELDAAALTVAELQSLEAQMHVCGWGEKTGRACLVNEAHALRKPVIRQLLVLLERIPRHVVIVFTTTCEGQEALFEDYDDASPLLSR